MPAANNQVLLVPLDERPCTYDFPQTIAAIGARSIQVPLRQLLGNYQRPAQLTPLTAWIQNNLADSSALLLALDTWIYGGLVPSRRSVAPLDELLLRLHDLKTWSKHVPIHGFATLMRISNSNDTTEEPLYWGDYGPLIYRYSVLAHQTQIEPTPALKVAKAQLQRQIPTEVLADYAQRRVRNLKILEHLLQLVSSGVLSTLLIGYDDASSRFGWNVQERIQLQTWIDERGLTDSVLLYPGADELASVLVARILWPAVKEIQIKFSQPLHQTDITRYEGIPLQDTLQLQLQAVGCTWVNEGEAILYIHNAPAPQQDQFLERETAHAPSPEKYQQWAQNIHDGLNTQPVALADCYYANGGDASFLDTLEQAHLLWRLAGYSAWNTVGNTLGFALAWLKAYLAAPQPNVAHLRCLAERLLDDGYYQGRWRQQLCRHYTQPVKLNDCLHLIHTMNEKLQIWQPDYQEQGITAFEVKHLSFPWRRFFEIDVQVCLHS